MPTPLIQSISPQAATPGQKITVNGSGFSNATSVKIGGFDVLLFQIISDSVIYAFAPIEGTGTLSVTNPSGTTTIGGFTAILSRVKIIDLPPLGRLATTSDITYVWDVSRNVLCQAPVNDITGSVIPDPGVYTALGSPFKIRSADQQYAYDAATNSVTITDVRLLGKEDYVVSSTDVNGEFENDRISYDKIAGSFTISNYQLTSGRHITIYADGVVSPEFTSYVTTLKSKIDALELATAPFRPSLNSSNVMAAPGGIIAWFRPANEIPMGWTEYIPGRGRVLIGQDPSDTASPTNPNPLSLANGTPGGSKSHVIDSMSKIIKHRFHTMVGQDANLGPFPFETGRMISAARTMIRAWFKSNAGAESYYMYGATSENSINPNPDGTYAFEPTVSPTNWLGKSSPDPIDHMNPYRIVNFIISTQTV